MSASQLHPTGFYEFRLGHGTLKTREGARMVVMPDAILARLLGIALEQRDLGAIRTWGSELGAIAAKAAGHRVESLSAEVGAEVISGALGLSGLGHASLERWGDLLAVRLDSPLSFDGAKDAYAALFAGVFESLFEAEVACVPVGPETRFVIVHPSIVEIVRSQVTEGAVIADLATRLAAPEDA